MEDTLFFSAISGLAISIIAEMCKRYHWNMHRTVLILALIGGFVFTLFKQFTPQEVAEKIVSVGAQTFGISTIIYVFFIKLIKGDTTNK